MPRDTSISGTPIVRTVGDSLLGFQGVIRTDGEQLELSPFEIAVEIVGQGSEEEPVAGGGNVTVQPSHAFTANVDADRVTCVGHRLQSCDQVEFASTDTLPAGLYAERRYFVVNSKTNSFQVSDEPDGLPLTITDEGEGEHSFKVPGEIRYNLAPEDVAVPGEFWLSFVLSLDGETAHVTVALRVVE